jgi:hypothetical protein
MVFGVPLQTASPPRASVRRAGFTVLLTAWVVLVAGCGTGHPVVPLRVQRTIEQEYPGKAYFPTRLPRGYRYHSWGHDVGLYDLAFVKTDASGKVVSGITFSVNPTPYVAPGLEGANPNEAFQINRHTEYWVGSAHYDSSAWRWVWNHGQPVRITAANDSAHTNAMFVAYAQLAK